MVSGGWLDLWRKVWPPLVGLVIGLGFLLAFGVLTAMADMEVEMEKKCYPKIWDLPQPDGTVDTRMETCDGEIVIYRGTIPVCGVAT